MKKIEKRALLCLLFGLILLGGVCFFIYEDWNEGGAWAVYEGNRDVYADGDLALTRRGGKAVPTYGLRRGSRRPLPPCRPR